MRYRKLPVEVVAVQWNGDNFDMLEQIDAHGRLVRSDDGGIFVPTLEGETLLLPGNWLVRGVKGELYPVRADIFDETYERCDG